MHEKHRELGLTQKKLAKRAEGVSERLIVALELGDATDIRLDKMLQVLDALDLSLTVLGAKNGEERPKKRVEYAVVGLPDIIENYQMPPELTLFPPKRRPVGAQGSAPLRD